MSHLKELSAIKKAIKRKVAALKVGAMENAVQFEKTYRPIIEPLQQIASASSIPASTLPQATSTPLIKIRKKAPATPFKDNSVVVDAESSSETEVQEPSYNESMTNPTLIENYNLLPRTYIDGLTHDVKREYDLAYGVRYDPEMERWMMGNKEIQIDGDDFLVVMASNLKSRYVGTRGLYELIFKKFPIDYTDTDKLEYVKILDQTNSYRQKYDSNMPINGSSSYKYRDIIKPLLKLMISTKPNEPPSKPTGRGYDASMVVDDRREKYVYFDNYDELVDRMRLLYASKEAGNNCHDNEIASIIEELKEARIIY